MVLSRAFLGTTLGTALGLSLAGCAADIASPGSATLVAGSNHAAAASISVPHPAFSTLSPAVGGPQVASLDPAVGAATSSVVQKGTVLWRRTPEEAELAPAAPVGEEIRRLQETLSELKGLTVSNSQTIAQVAGDQARRERELRSQTAEAVTSVATMATESIRQWQGASQQMAQLEDRLKTNTDLKVSKAQAEGQLAAVREARYAASEAELRARNFTNLQVADLRKLNEETRSLASSEISNVAAALRQYGDIQLQQVAASTSATLASLAAATDQSVADLRTQTNRRLGTLWQDANRRAARLAEQKANVVAASLVALQAETEARRLTPDQIRAIAEQTVAESTPEFRAIALQTMQEGQDYIRATARAAVQDKDPAMQTALADAARDVITKDDRVVFAIRKAVAEELQGVALDASATNISLGPDHALAVASGEADLDPNRLRIAQLLAPAGGPAADAAKLAALSPAAGTAPQSAGGQQSWSVPGTSLTRARNRADWMDIRQYKVIVHEDNQTMEELLGKVLKNAEPFTGPWQVRWKISDENRDVLTEKFSLDAEANFEEFVSYLAQYVVNDRGVKLSFSLFDNERIIVISD